jgi:hypothetical protein
MAEAYPRRMDNRSALARFRDPRMENVPYSLPLYRRPDTIFDTELESFIREVVDGVRRRPVVRWVEEA